MKEDEIDYECGCVLKKGEGPWYVEMFCPEHDPSIKETCAHCQRHFQMSAEAYECHICNKTVCEECRIDHFVDKHAEELQKVYPHILEDNFKHVLVS